VKDLLAGKKLSSLIQSISEWRDSKLSQTEVPLVDLVAEVTGILARHPREALSIGVKI
jgi:hypothetical protein